MKKKRKHGQPYHFKRASWKFYLVISILFFICFVLWTLGSIYGGDGEVFPRRSFVAGWNLFTSLLHLGIALGLRHEEKREELEMEEEEE